MGDTRDDSEFTSQYFINSPLLLSYRISIISIIIFISTRSPQFPLRDPKGNLTSHS